MGLKVYLASRFGRQAELRGYREKLQALGIEVTSTWLDVERDEQQVVYTDEQLAAAAAENLHDIAIADVLIVFTDRDDGSQRGGHHVEMGFALKGGLDLVLFGPRINLFHYHEDVLHFPDLSFDDYLATHSMTDEHSPRVPYDQTCARCGLPNSCKLRWPGWAPDHPSNGHLVCASCRGFA